MSQDKRRAVVIDGNEIVNTVVIPAGDRGDELLAANPDWVEVTGMKPRPGVDTGWTYVDGAFVAPPEVVKTREIVEAERRFAYQTQTDPLFFQYQRGEITEKQWKAAVAKVKKAHPYPAEK